MRADFDWIPQQNDTTFFEPRQRSQAGGSGHIVALADRLQERRLLDDEQKANALQVHQHSPDRNFCDILIDLGVDEHAIMSELSDLTDLPLIELEPDDIDVKLVEQVGSEFCRRHHLLPIRREKHRLVIGTSMPGNVIRLDDVKRTLDAPSVREVLVTSGDIGRMLDALASELHGDVDVEAILADVEIDDIEFDRAVESEADESDAESSPVVRYVNHIIQSAVRDGASDIHIEPGEQGLKVRFRVDGVLYESMSPPRKMHAAITSRLKIMAQLDIAERRLPQDGRIQATVLGRPLDLRISTVPTPHGEKTVMRLLDNRSIDVPMEGLGFTPVQLDTWQEQIDRPHGIILVTGPTGSGKTTTLYASLQQMDLARLNVSTVEDPVEYRLGGITQIQVHERIDLTFATTLRSLLRQDPDVIMVGEIRDLETATIATQAALTGHLVLSTLHTNDAPSSITRLINIGIEPFLVAGAVNAVLAQRLARRICPACITQMPTTEEAQQFLHPYGTVPEMLAAGTGCRACRESGYAGRLALYELLTMNDTLRDRVASNPTVIDFRNLCRSEGMSSLRDEGVLRVLDGTTTIEEVLRVTDALG
jgi:type IV pilus assembly protein PilB